MHRLVEQLQTEITKANQVLGKNQSVPKDLHRPYIDDIVLVADNGEPLYRELDLIDVWFDSGAMPYAQWHYPFENKDGFEFRYPADFIAEGVDQTRGWFYTLHAIAVMVFDSVAFKNVVSNGLVLDKNGQKMSKRLGNAVDPFDTVAKYGADATRWYMIANAQVWDNLRFDLAGIEETTRLFFGKLYNTYSFFALYANIDNFRYLEADIPMWKRPEIDRWILSTLHSLVNEVDADFAQYESTNAARKMMQFVDEHLSNWYVRLCRRRFWKGDYTDDKISAYQTLYECLNTLAKLMAPIAPFFADWLYKNLNEATRKETFESVHLALLESAGDDLIDKALEQRMDYAQRLSSLVLSLRKKHKINVRQPLQKMIVPVLDEKFIEQLDGVKDLILSEVNVKELEYLTDASGLLKKRIKPNFKTLGKRLGPHMKAAQEIINNLSQAEINEIEKTKAYTLKVGDTSFELNLEDFEIAAEDIPGWLVANDGPLTVALDITITPALAAEGMARELVNRIQNIRKTRDFNVTDRIQIDLEQHPAVEEAVAQFGQYIQDEVLAVRLDLVAAVEGEVLDLKDEVVVKVRVELA